MAPALPAPAIGLEGRAPDQIRALTAVLVAGMCCAVAAGAIFDLRRAKAGVLAGHAVVDDRPRGWVLGLLASSYTLLIPGLMSTLFSFHIAAMETISLQKATESMIQFIRTLGSTGGWLGSSFVVLFAIVIPAVKLVLLVVGEIWRHSTSLSHVAAARRCIALVQLVSKWACPDMFAYILLLYLVRSLNHPPTLEGLMQLDLGFTCFSLFCLGSTVSALGISLPDPTDTAAPSARRRTVVEDVEAARGSAASGLAAARVVTISEAEELAPRGAGGAAFELLGVRGTALMSVALAIAFAGLLVAGMAMPCMALRLNMDMLIENGTIPAAFEDFARNTLHLPDLARADVSIWKCLAALIGWIGEGDANCIIAFIMLAVFVLLLSVLDVLVLCMVSVQCLGGGKCSQMPSMQPAQLMPFSHVLKKLSMLDVFIMGVIIVVLSGSIYKSEGLVLSIRWGLAALLGAELCHYALHALVSTAAAEHAATAVEDMREARQVH